MPKYAEPPSSQELRDAIRRILDRSGLSEAEAGRRLGFAAPSQLNRRLNDGKPPFSREEIERICRVFALDDEQRIELLRLRGDVVIAQQGQAPQVVAVDQLQSVLAGLIGQSLKAELSALPALIAEAARGIIPWEILRERISRTSLDVGDVSGTGIAIGDGAQSHVITIESLQVWLPPPPPPPDPLPLLEAMPVEDEAPVPPADQAALGLVPHRIDLLPNEQFIGRDRELRALARQLKAGRNVVVTTGMGGIGKTQLASEFAYRYGRYFAGGVFWIDCSIPERVPTEIPAGGGPGGLDLPGFADLPDEERVRRVKEAWKQAIPRLLIFDNCEDEKLLRAHRPGPGGCRVLVTSRRQQWSAGQNLTPLDLEALERPFSIALLQKLANPFRSEPIRSEQANDIADELGDLPLALHLAGSYLGQFASISPEAFLEEVRAKRLEQPALANTDELYVPTLEAQRRASSLYAVLTLGLERLDPAGAVGDLARTLLAWASCLEPPGATFPRDLLSRAAPIDGAGSEQARRVDQALNLLINLGFLDPEAGGRLRMHRLIAAAVRQARLVEDPLASFAPAALGYCAELITRANTMITGGQTVEGRALLEREQALWSQFLDWSYEREAGQGTSLGARATAELGNYWTLIGGKGKEETSTRLRRALDLARRAEDRLGEANVLQAIGDVQQFRDDRDGALGSYQQALALFREIGDHLGEANVLKAIGDVQQFRDDRDGALGSYQQALALFREIGAKLGEANVLAALSRFMIDSDPPQSQALLQQALTLREAIDDAYSMGADLGNYGIALLQRGRGAEALPYLERARAIFAARGIQHLLPQMDALIAQARGGGAAPAGPIDSAQIIQRFLPLLLAIARVALGDDGPRAAIEQALAQLEAKGWRLSAAVARILAGERERDALVAGLDAQDTALIDRVLALVAERERGER